MYRITKYSISRKKYPALYDYCDHMTALSRNLHNAALFRLRQWFTSYGKEYLQPLQREVIEEVEKTCRTYGKGSPSKIISYAFLEKLMRCTENPDFFNGLPMQSSQWVIKQAVNDFKNWQKSLAAYYRDPSSFTGKPKMPGYAKSAHHTLTLTNQDCVIYEKDDGKHWLKLPKTKETIGIHCSDKAHLKEVKIRPQYGEYMIIVTYEDEGEIPEREAMYMAGIDLGVDNIAAFVSNDAKAPVLYKGGALKARNQFFNKNRAKYTGILMKGHDPKKVCVHSHMLDSIAKNRSFFLNDEMHKISSHIIQTCIERKIGVIVIGKNDQWKTKSKMSRENNQKFVSIPHNTLIHMITYKAEREGIKVILQEESYTSKASFLDQDEIPVYGSEECESYEFSGKRITRGLYRSKNGTVISSDINGSANILRKAHPEAFEGTEDYRFLQEVKTVGFREIRNCSCSGSKVIQKWIEGK